MLNSGKQTDRCEATYPMNDMGNSLRFVDKFGEDTLYCNEERTWYIWNGKRWEPDKRDQVYLLAEESVNSVYEDLPDEVRERNKTEAFALRSVNRRNLVHLVKSSGYRVPISPDEFDTGPFTFNCQNGEIDLDTGKLRKHRRGSYNTKMSPVRYNPNSSCRTWLEFLDRVFDGDSDIIDYLQVALGYSLTGDVSEQVFFVLQGSGANGKSTLLNTVLYIMGGYAQQAPTGLLLRRYSNHSTEIADLKGLRLVSTIETNDGQRFDEALIKTVTGGDRIRARRIYEGYIEFDPTHKIFFATNHLPDLSDTSEAMRRRFRFIRFNVIIPEKEQDKRLQDKLKAEGEGILAWIVRGCLQWLKNGLPNPVFSTSEVDRYFGEMDYLGRFVEDCCRVGGSVKAKPLYNRYAKWCKENGETAVSHTKFGTDMRGRGFDKTRKSEGVVYRGLSLK